MAPKMPNIMLFFLKHDTEIDVVLLGAKKAFATAWESLTLHRNQ